MKIKNNEFLALRKRSSKNGPPCKRYHIFKKGLSIAICCQAEADMNQIATDIMGKKIICAHCLKIVKQRKNLYKWNTK